MAWEGYLEGREESEPASPRPLLGPTKLAAERKGNGPCSAALPAVCLSLDLPDT